MTDEELQEIEADFGFRFPPDLRRLLSGPLPPGEGWPDWRKPHSQEMLEWLDEPAEGIAAEVEQGFWFAGWGERPEDEDDAVEEARRQVALAPILIPLHGDDYLPAGDEGNPVFQVVGSEVAVVAPTLEWWLHERWGYPAPAGKRPQPKRIPLWSALAETE